MQIRVYESFVKGNMDRATRRAAARFMRSSGGIRYIGAAAGFGAGADVLRNSNTILQRDLQMEEIHSLFYAKLIVRARRS